MIRSTRHPHGARFWLALLIVTPAMLALSAAAEGGLVAHLTFDQDSGSTAYDSVDGHHGALTNMDPSTDWVAGKIGNALDFDGGNDYVLVPDHDDLDFGTGDFSVSYWVYKRATGPGWHNVWGINKWRVGGTPGSSEWSTGLTPDGVTGHDQPGLSVFVGPTTSDKYTVTSSVDVFDTSQGDPQWHHIVAVRHGRSLHVYVDTTKDSEIDILPRGASINNTGQSLRIANSAHNNYYTDAIFDDLQIYDMALSGWQVELLFDHPGAVAPVPEPATLAVWALLAAVAVAYGCLRKRLISK